MENRMEKGISFRNKQKEKLLDEWLQELDHALVHLDSRKTGVVVPENYTNNPTLTLKISYNFQGQITLSDEGVTAYLKFSGSYFECQLPWTAIWGVTGSDERNKIWSEDVPKELLVQMAKQKLGEIKGRLFGKKKTEDQPTPEKPKSKRASLLKRIK